MLNRVLEVGQWYPSCGAYFFRELTYDIILWKLKPQKKTFLVK